MAKPREIPSKCFKGAQILDTVGIGQDNTIFGRKIFHSSFLPIRFTICFGCSKEPSHLDGSFEYSQHMFSLKNKKLRTLI